jgi:SagB-type dehydrogenase family enzyme
MAAGAGVVELLSLRADVQIERREDGCAVAGPQACLPLGPVGAGVAAALSLLGTGDAHEGALLDAVETNDGFMAVPAFSLALDRLGSLGFLRRTVSHDGRRLVTLVTNAPGQDGAAAGDLAVPAVPAVLLVFSRHAILRNDRGRVVAESPLSAYQIVFDEPALAVSCLSLTAPRAVSSLSRLAGFSDLPAEATARIVELLVLAGILCRATGAGDTESDPAPHWELHDLYFHSRSRLGRHANPYGATYRLRGIMDPLPLIKPPMSSETEALPVPDLDRLALRDRPFSAVLEQRRSSARYGDAPITRSELGELLYRSARQRRVVHTEHGDASDRPYPSGGALYELEIYPVIDRCEGLVSGIYHYRPAEHALSRITGRTPEVEELLGGAWAALGRHDRPHVVLVVTARFARLAWKYEAVAYALTLKHVGVLYQTFYLVGTSMGLATSALGVGDADLFARATDVDWLAESSVGEFALGSRPRAREGAST